MKAVATRASPTTSGGSDLSSVGMPTAPLRGVMRRDYSLISKGPVTYWTQSVAQFLSQVMLIWQALATPRPLDPRTERSPSPKSSSQLLPQEGLIPVTLFKRDQNVWGAAVRGRWGLLGWVGRGRLIEILGLGSQKQGWMGQRVKWFKKTINL